MKTKKSPKNKVLQKFMSDVNSIQMEKEVAIWLIDNTGLTFKQISAFCSLPEIQIKALADGVLFPHLKGQSPIDLGYVTKDSITEAEADPSSKLKQESLPDITGVEFKKSGATYTPLLTRRNRIAGILWITSFHPEIPDSAIVKLLKTTKSTVDKVRSGSYRGLSEIFPKDPSATGICGNGDLKVVIAKYHKEDQKTETPAVSKVEDPVDLPQEVSPTEADLVSENATETHEELEVDLAKEFPTED